MSAINIQWPNHTVSVAIRDTHYHFLSAHSVEKGQTYQNISKSFMCRIVFLKAVTVLPSPKHVQLSEALIGTRQNIPLLTALDSVGLLLAYVPWDS